MNIERRKTKLVRRYGKVPTICYYYYLWNVVDYCGEERVRQSFNSIKGRGNEVIVGIYDPKDNTKKIAEEYGFKVVVADKDPNFVFAESKIRNKVIFESESNFLVPLNINVEYPRKFHRYIVDWIKNNNIKGSRLKLRCKFRSSDGKIRKNYGFSTLFYKPFLIEARGYDERTSYGCGSQLYGVKLLNDIFKLTPIVARLNMVHKFHNNFKMPMVGKIYPNIDHDTRRKHVRKLIYILIHGIMDDFKTGVKKVKNSYW